MAGNGSRAGSGRGAGGATKAAGGAGAPPRPSAMKVNLFQQASREARQRSSNSVARAQSRIRNLERQPQAQMAGDDGGRKNIVGRQRSAWGIRYRTGGLDPTALDGVATARRRARGYRAPSTRLF